MTTTEWVIVNGHVLGQCAYLRSLDKPWTYEEDCDCSDLLEDDPIWGRTDEDEWADEPGHTATGTVLTLEPVRCRCPHGEDWHAAGGCEARECSCEVEPR